MRGIQLLLTPSIELSLPRVAHMTINVRTMAPSCPRYTRPSPVTFCKEKYPEGKVDVNGDPE